jgi:hypothetical protein
MMNGIRLCSLRGSVEDHSGDKQQVWWKFPEECSLRRSAKLF